MRRRNPFHIAERYIQLRKRCSPDTWLDTASRVNDMILLPLIALFRIFLGNRDILMVASTLMKAFYAWREYIEYYSLRLQVQMMMLQTALAGGPVITTNDPAYLPYVFADAVYRSSSRKV